MQSSTDTSPCQYNDVADAKILPMCIDNISSLTPLRCCFARSVRKPKLLLHLWFIKSNFMNFIGISPKNPIDRSLLSFGRFKKFASKVVRMYDKEQARKRSKVVGNFIQSNGDWRWLTIFASAAGPVISPRPTPIQ